MQHTGSPDFAELKAAGMNGMYLVDHWRRFLERPEVYLRHLV
ncbi:hypothetical protein ACNPQM_34970 [Streptomyces sp. NPDC056231]